MRFAAGGHGPMGWKAIAGALRELGKKKGVEENPRIVVDVFGDGKNPSSTITVEGTIREVRDEGDTIVLEVYEDKSYPKEKTK